MLKTFDKNHTTDLSKQYYFAQPFPHLVIDDYLDKTFAKNPEKECRLASHNIDASNGFTQTGKVALNDWSLFSPLIEKTCCYFNSGSFINLLEQITGIHNLISDPFLTGAGVHRTQRGGYLKMHTDFNFSKRLDLHRRVNVLYYLNSNYEKAWGGELLLSLSPAREEISAMKAIEPVFNRLVIFNTNDKTFHGHPLPHGFPPGIDRTSLAFYYYSTKKPLSEKNRLATETTKYVPTKDDSIKAKDGSLKSQIGYHLRRWTAFG